MSMDHPHINKLYQVFEDRLCPAGAASSRFARAVVAGGRSVPWIGVHLGYVQQSSQYHDRATWFLGASWAKFGPNLTHTGQNWTKSARH